MISAKKKIAIIGMNEIGHKHFSELRRSDYFELVGVYDKDCKDDFGRIDLYDDLDRLFEEKNPDAVVVCVAPNEHKSLIFKIITYVRNILVDAPFALNLEECREIKYAARNNEANIAIFYEDRFNPTIMSLLKEFSKGFKIYTMNFIRGIDNENKANIMNDFLLKELDLARILSGYEISSFESKNLFDESGKEIQAISVSANIKNEILLSFICSNLYVVPIHSIQISANSGVYLADLQNFTLHKLTPNGNINLKVENENFCFRLAQQEFYEFCENGVLKHLAGIDEVIKIRELLK